jgi:hypothetical protein
MLVSVENIIIPDSWSFTIKNFSFSLVIVSIILKNEHSCGKEPDPRENESRILRVRVRNKSGDVTKRPAAVIRNELRDMNENNKSKNTNGTPFSFLSRRG